MRLSIVKEYNAKSLKINNTFIDGRLISNIMQTESILNFPIEIKGNSDMIDNDSKTLNDMKQYTGYAIFDMVLGDEFVFDRLRKIFSNYSYIITVKKRNLMGFISDIRLVLFVDAFRFADFKLLGSYIQDLFKEHDLDAKIVNKYNQYNCILHPTNSIEHISNEGDIMTHKLIKCYKRPKNHRTYKPEIYPVVLELFKELGFFPEGRFSTISDKVYFTHEGTNTKGYLWYPNSPFNLWHTDPNKKINVYSLFSERYKYKDFIIKQTIDEKISRVGTQLEVIEKKVDLSKLTVANRTFFSEWGNKNDNSILCIKSAMGSAKTNVIRKLMESNKTLIITPRSQLAVELARKTGAQCYLNESIDYKRHLICQFDSLFKFDLSQYTHFILDEYMTLESHITQCKPETLVKNMHKLQYALNSNVILIDAMLTQNCLDIFSNQRRTAYWYENNVIDNTPLMRHKTIESFMKSLCSMQGKRITISSTSKAKLLSLQSYVDTIGYSNRIIIGETPIEERTKILDDFNRGKFDCLLYSPAISVGISIDSEAYRHFHLDPGGIVSPIQSIQMLKRSRNIKQIDVFLQKRKRYSTTSIEEIRNEIKNAGYLCEYDFKGDQMLSQAGKTLAWIIRHDNIWRAEGLDSFTYLASLNFDVSCDVEVAGSDEFNADAIKKFADNSEKWSPELRRLTQEYFGDNILVEDYIEPEQLGIFKYYSDLKKCYREPKQTDFIKIHQYAKNNFDFDMDLSKFIKVMQSIDKDGVYKCKNDEDLSKYGFVKSSSWSILSTSWVERRNFVELFKKLYENILIDDDE